MKRIFYIFILVFMLFLVSCNNTETSKIEIIGSDTIEIGFDSEYKIKYDGEEKEFTDFYWIIDNTNAVSRYDNVLTGLQAGVVNLRLVFKEDASVYAVKTINVIDSIVESVQIRGQKEKAEVGSQFIVYVNTDPADAIDRAKPIWTSSNDNVVIDPADESAIITCVGEGDCTINVRCSSAQATFSLQIYKPITEIEMYNDDELCVNCAMSLNFNIEDAVIEALSDNIELEGTYLYAKEAGVASIKVSQKNNKKLPANTFTINIVDNKENKDVTSEEAKLINDYLSKMTLKQKIGQMILLNLTAQNSGWRRVDYNLSKDDKGMYYYPNNDEAAKVYTKALLKSYPFGNYNLNSVLTNKEPNISNGILGMQNYFIDELKIGGIISADIENLGEGFNTYLNNLTIGTINDLNVTERYYQLLCDDIRSAGINTLISPVFSDYERSYNKYSNLQEKQVIYSTIFKDTFDQENVSLSPHFRHTLSSDKDSILSAINEGIEAISIDHTEYILSGKKNVLRDKGYKGLIIDTQSHYDYNQTYQYEGTWYSDSEFYYLESYYINAINSGVNMFKIDIYLESENDRYNYRSTAKNAETFNFLNRLEELVNNGSISMEMINDSVSKILLYKIRNNIIDGTYPDDEYSKNDDNQQVINEIDNGYNTIAISGTYQNINKKGEVNIIFDNSEISSLVGNVSYISRGYKNLNRYQATKDNLYPESNDAGINKISSSSTVIMFIENGEYQYNEVIQETYEGQTYEYTAVNYINVREVYNLVAEKCDHIILVFMEDPEVANYFDDVDCMKIFLNYCGWDNLGPLFDVLDKNKATGVCINEK